MGVKRAAARKLENELGISNIPLDKFHMEYFYQHFFPSEPFHSDKVDFDYCKFHKNVGVLGYMALWGVNLESVSMITIIMSIGFSVDLSAHITYAYVNQREQTMQQQLQLLKHMAGLCFWRILQSCRNNSADLGGCHNCSNIFQNSILDDHIQSVTRNSVFAYLTRCSIAMEIRKL
uniref:Uncharacterized protein n=1 Tax=Ditylenchus dipsaci TaxID=166011 RepID=A0A915D804_9BILA